MSIWRRSRTRRAGPRSSAGLAPQPCQKKTRVFIKRAVSGNEVHILCRSDGRQEKDRAIRGSTNSASSPISPSSGSGRRAAACASREGPRGPGPPQGTLRPRGALLRAGHDDATRAVTWTGQAHLQTRAQQLDGTYLLRTDRQDLTEEEVWRLYMLLTRWRRPSVP